MWEAPVRLNPEVLQSDTTLDFKVFFSDHRSPTALQLSDDYGNQNGATDGVVWYQDEVETIVQATGKYMFFGALHYSMDPDDFIGGEEATTQDGWPREGLVVDVEIAEVDCPDVDGASGITIPTPLPPTPDTSDGRCSDYGGSELTAYITHNMNGDYYDSPIWANGNNGNIEYVDLADEIFEFDYGFQPGDILRLTNTRYNNYRVRFDFTTQEDYELLNTPWNYPNSLEFDFSSPWIAPGEHYDLVLPDNYQDHKMYISWFITEDDFEEALIQSGEEDYDEDGYMFCIKLERVISGSSGPIIAPPPGGSTGPSAPGASGFSGASIPEAPGLSVITSPYPDPDDDGFIGYRIFVPEPDNLNGPPDFPEYYNLPPVVVGVTPGMCYRITNGGIYPEDGDNNLLIEDFILPDIKIWFSDQRNPTPEQCLPSGPDGTGPEWLPAFQSALYQASGRYMFFTALTSTITAANLHLTT